MERTACIRQPPPSAILHPGADGSDTRRGDGPLSCRTVLWVGTLYWKLHSLPERMAHKSRTASSRSSRTRLNLALTTNISWVAGACSL